METMMVSRDWPLSQTPGSGARALVVGLRMASVLLVRLARWLDGRGARHAPRLERQLEFYADAGAPEGALYVDGQLVGRLPGVTRL